MISKGNTKIGTIPNFSLPPIRTCPGQTDFCKSFCYGLRGHFTHETTLVSLSYNFLKSQQSYFTSYIVKSIQRSKSPVFRIHVVGDFYSPAYTLKWLSIVHQLPDVSFYGYTRSWRVPFLKATWTNLDPSQTAT